jgi:hypothetical protein
VQNNTPSGHTPPSLRSEDSYGNDRIDYNIEHPAAERVVANTHRPIGIGDGSNG